MTDNTFTVIGAAEAWERDERKNRPVREWMDAEHRKAIVTGAGFNGIVYNKELLLKLSQMCDIEQSIIHEYDKLLENADYEGIYNFVAHNNREYHKGRDNLFSSVMYDIGVYHKPPSMVVGERHVEIGDSFETGRFDAVYEILYFMGTIVLDQSTDLYDKDWKGNH